MILVLILVSYNCFGLVNIINKSYWDDLEYRSVNVTTRMHFGAGFFAEFGKVIKSLIYYEQDGIKSMHVDWTNQFFPYKNKPNENGWDLYFEPISINTDLIDLNDSTRMVGWTNSHELHDQKCVAQWLRYDDYLPYRLFVHKKINEHIRIKKHIVSQIENFYNKHMKDYICIGVHVRYASAHASETPKGHPSLETYCSEVNRLLKAHRNKNVKIFLASDSYKVINYFKERYGNKLVYKKTHRAQDKEDPSLIYENSNYWMNNPQKWHKSKPGYEGGLGVLSDCLLLSKCDYLIHITSNVATYACFFNPHLKSIYLPRGVPFKHCRYRNNQTIRNKFLNPI